MDGTFKRGSSHLTPQQITLVRVFICETDTSVFVGWTKTYHAIKTSSSLVSRIYWGSIKHKILSNCIVWSCGIITTKQPTKYQSVFDMYPPETHLISVFEMKSPLLKLFKRRNLTSTSLASKRDTRFRYFTAKNQNVSNNGETDNQTSTANAKRIAELTGKVALKTRFKRNPALNITHNAGVLFKCKLCFLKRTFCCF